MYYTRVVCAGLTVVPAACAGDGGRAVRGAWGAGCGERGAGTRVVAQRDIEPRLGAIMPPAQKNNCAIFQ